MVCTWHSPHYDCTPPAKSDRRSCWTQFNAFTYIWVWTFKLKLMIPWLSYLCLNKIDCKTNNNSLSLLKLDRRRLCHMSIRCTWSGNASQQTFRKQFQLFFFHFCICFYENVINEISDINFKWHKISLKNVKNSNENGK